MDLNELDEKFPLTTLRAQDAFNMLSKNSLAKMANAFNRRVGSIQKLRGCTTTDKKNYIKNESRFYDKMHTMKVAEILTYFATNNMTKKDIAECFNRYNAIHPQDQLGLTMQFEETPFSKTSTLISLSRGNVRFSAEPQDIVSGELVALHEEPVGIASNPVSKDLLITYLNRDVGKNGFQRDMYQEMNYELSQALLENDPRCIQAREQMLLDQNYDASMTKQTDRYVEFIRTSTNEGIERIYPEENDVDFDLVKTTMTEYVFGQEA